MKLGRKPPSADTDLLKAEKELTAANRELAWELSKVAVDVAGFVDPTPISDAVSMGMSLIDGDYVGAGLSLISMVPYAGDALAKTTKGARAAKKILKLQKKIAALAAKVRTLKTSKGASKVASKAVKKAATKQAKGVCVECAKRAKQAKQTAKAKKPPPNPHGRHGSPAHRSQVKRRAAELKAKGHTIIGGGGSKPEKAVFTPDGRKRYPDITTRGPDGKIYHENVGRVTQAGTPVARERRALQDIDAATGRQTGYTPYYPKKK